MTEWSIIGIDWRVPFIGPGEYYRRSGQHTKIDQDFASEIKRSGLVVVDMSFDPCPWQWIKDQIPVLAEARIQDRVLFLTSNFAVAQHPNAIYFPSIVYRMSMINAHSARDLGPTPRWRISSLNRMPRPHRMYLVYQLLGREWSDSTIVTWRGFRDEHEKNWLLTNEPAYGQLPEQIIETVSKWHFQATDLPCDHYWSVTVQDWNHPAYTDCCLNIVTETDCKDCEPFLSEKICKPLGAGQLFLVVGNPNTIACLRQLGFECFDQDLDQHDYDTKLSFLARIDQMMAWCDDCHDHLPDMWQRNKAALRHNMQWLLSADFRQKLLEPLVQQDLIY